MPTTLDIPVMSELYTSRRYGYSILYPADWSVEQASQTWWPPDWKADASPGEPFDYIRVVASRRGSARPPRWSRKAWLT